MVHVVALCTGGRHNGGVGNGGAVIAADGTGHAGGHTDDAHGRGQIEDIQGNGNQNAESAPAGAGGKGQKCADDENNGGEQRLESGGGALDGGGNEDTSAQGIGHGFQRPSKGQNQNSRDHGLEAFGNAVHHVTEGHGTTAQVEDESQHHGKGGAQHQTHRGVGTGKGVHEVLTGEEAAGVDHADDAADNEGSNGENKINDVALGIHIQLFFRGIGIGAGEYIAPFDGVAFMAGHGAEIGLEHHQSHHHDDGQQRIEIVGNGPDEQGETGAVLHKAGHGGSPGGDGGNDADGGGGGVDQIGQLGTGHLMLVGDRPHNGTDGQTVKVIINKDQHTENDGGQLSAGAALDALLCPATERGAAACLVHQADHSAQNHQEDENAHIIRAGQHRDDAVFKDVEHGPLEVEVGVQQAAGQNADEQGGIDLLGNQRQRDGDDRGQQGPNGIIIVAGGVDLPHTAAGGADVGPGAVGTGRVQTITGHAGRGAAAVGALHQIGGRLSSGHDGDGQRGQNHDHHQQGEQGSPVSQIHRISSKNKNAMVREADHDRLFRTAGTSMA